MKCYGCSRDANRQLWWFGKVYLMCQQCWQFNAAKVFDRIENQRDDLLLMGLSLEEVNESWQKWLSRMKHSKQ